MTLIATTATDIVRREPNDREDANAAGHLTATSAMGDYLSRIGRVALLSAEEEVSLAQSMEVGLFAEHLMASRADPGLRERLEFETLAQEGRAARERMIEANLRLVVHLAKRYPWAGEDLRRELIQEGNIGLIRAVERFDYRRGVRFSTMASHWIVQGFSRVWGAARGIRLPSQIADQVRKVSAAESALRDTLHRDPTIAEIAAAVGESPRRVADLIVVGRDLASLNTLVGEDGTELDHQVVDESTQAPDEAVMAQFLERAVQDAVGSLPQPSRDVITIRFGIGGQRPASLEESAEILGLPVPRVRQLEGKALGSLRHPSRARQLQAFAA